MATNLPASGLFCLDAWRFYKTGDAKGALPTQDPFQGLAENFGKSIEPMQATLQRIETLARARVVEVANQEEQELLKRIIQLLHVTGFPKRLKELLREVEGERGKHIVRNAG